MAKKASKNVAPKKPLVHLSQASESRRRAVVRDVNKVLLAHGVRGKLSELHLTSGPAGDDECPPGQTKQVVCQKQPDGSFLCREECV
jgi:hypothetical protein